ncbi:tryptamine hydroxycinnamoyltransferase 1-like [Ananas comosus]|uniref:Tryptamine hydroxycinnamoyltransferase 1-like n=1 Tax=Ananas comosus TaxID=4615 RepID=A0A6P5G128_ANACO|nr:tryptamine hydroxycinnamoyltransferase 1-like [Ananas comosus]
MEVQVQRTTIISHSDPTAVSSEVPLSVFDRFTSNIHIVMLFAFVPPIASNESLIDGLKRTLVHFPALTAQLSDGREHSRRPCLVIGGEGGGALLLEAAVASNLLDHLPFEPSRHFKLLHPLTEEPEHLFQVQLNRFKCGGLVIAMTFHHQVADGQSMSTFFVAWGRAVRGLAIEKPPVFDRSLLKPRSPPKYEFPHRGFEFLPLCPNQDGLSLSERNINPSDIANIVLRYPLEYIAKLKAELNRKYTTFETLSAYLWRKITIARGLAEQEYATIRISVNGRRRLQPPLPDEFFGNVVLVALPGAKVKLLIEGGLSEAAQIVHEGIQKIDDHYFQSFIDFGAIHGDEELQPVYALEGNVLSPAVEADSWLGFEFHKVDFGGGGGRLCGFIPAWVPADGLVVFIPGLGEGGGVDVFVSLIGEHAKVLSQISHTMD